MAKRSEKKSASAIDVEHFRQRLLDIERQLSELMERKAEGVRETVGDPGDAGDIALREALEDDQIAQIEKQAIVLSQVREALRRIDEGTFGRCVVDGRRISRKRLEAIPWTPYCLKHARAAEQQQPSRSATS